MDKRGLAARRRGLDRLPQVHPHETVISASAVGHLLADLVHAIQKRLKFLLGERNDFPCRLAPNPVCGVFGKSFPSPEGQTTRLTSPRLFLWRGLYLPQLVCPGGHPSISRSPQFEKNPSGRMLRLDNGNSRSITSTSPRRDG